jgi:Pyruvate/2-oxoacid:ferredoxin oxidoreductase delta subunit
MEISTNQNSIKLDDGTVVQFYPVKGRLKKTHCKHCFLLCYPGVDCTRLNVPCRDWERMDRKNGVFSIREMPNKNIQLWMQKN